MELVYLYIATINNTVGGCGNLVTRELINYTLMSYQLASYFLRNYVAIYQVLTTSKSSSGPSWSGKKSLVNGFLCHAWGQSSTVDIAYPQRHKLLFQSYRIEMVRNKQDR